MRSHLPQLTKRKLCLSAAHMPWHSEQARNERSGDDDFIRGSEQEKYDWNAGQASSAGETRQEAGNRQVPPAGPQRRALGNGDVRGQATSPAPLEFPQKTRRSPEPEADGKTLHARRGEVRMPPALGWDPPVEARGRPLVLPCPAPWGLCRLGAELGRVGFL